MWSDLRHELAMILHIPLQSTHAGEKNIDGVQKKVLLNLWLVLSNLICFKAGECAYNSSIESVDLGCLIWSNKNVDK